MEYSVSKLARIAGISIRTLHHYDKIGLLKPAIRAESRYRYYGKQELYRLQQILFFRELGFRLKDIKKILDDPDFDQTQALKYQRGELQKQRARLDTLLDTIDKTIKSIMEKQDMARIEDLYEGFSKENMEAWNKEVEEKYDSTIVNESRQNVEKLSQSQAKEILKEQERIAKEMAELLGEPVDSEKVVALMQRQHRTNEKFYKTSAEIFKGLGELYVSDARFTEYYDRFKPGTAVFMRDAMAYYADHFLK